MNLNKKGESKVNNTTILNTLKQKNIRKVVVEFSGGHDEGGADNINVYLNGQDDPITSISVWGAANKDEDNSILDKNLIDLLCKPIYDKYYSFAGEFSVYGELTWDTEKHSIKFNGSESVESYQHFEEEL